MSFFKQYKKSLKKVETEEFFDILIFRPLGYLIMKIFYNTKATPNFLTSVALVFGIGSGFLITQNEWIYMLYASIALIISNSFDCADGQLARAKQNGTKFGRIYDGLIDYFVYAAIYVAMAYNLHTSALAGIKYIWFFNEMYFLWWPIVLIAGASTSIQAIMFDGVRNEFTNYTSGIQSAFLVNELQKFRAEYEEIKNKKGNYRKKILYKLYFAYLNIQLKTASTTNENISSEEYYKKNKTIIRFWGLIGSTNHFIFLIVCALFMRLDIYVWGVIIPYNTLAFVLWLIQKSINKKNKLNSGIKS
jgi:phosphatidylglycerophosphate synthase